MVGMSKRAASQTPLRTGAPLPHGRLNTHLQRQVMDALRHLDAAKVGRLVPALVMLAEMRRVDDPRQRTARRLDSAEALAFVDAKGKRALPQIRAAARPWLRNGNPVPLHLPKRGRALREANEWLERGGYGIRTGHPWEHQPTVRGAFGALREGDKREDISAWRRWVHRWYGWMPEYMQPESRGGVKARRPREDKTLVADDPAHEIGQRHDMRQLFEAMTRRQQAAVQRLTRAATGSIPAWLVLAPEKPRGRPRKA